MSFVANMLSAGLRTFINTKYERYGCVRRLELNPSARTVDAEILLAGEDAPVFVQAAYALEPEEDKTMLIIREAQLSRAWMQALLADRYPDGLRLALPPQAAALLSKMA